jgi:hypothetical protein
MAAIIVVLERAVFDPGAAFPAAGGVFGVDALD